MNLFDTGLFNTGKILVGKFFANASDMFTDQCHKNFTLFYRHSRCCQAPGFSPFNPTLVAGCETAHGFCLEVRDFTKSILALLIGQ